MTDLADRITLYRARHDLSKVDFGLLVDVTGSTVCKWESGHNKPSYANLKRIEALLEDDKITDLNTIYLDELDYQIGRAQAEADGLAGVTLPDPTFPEDGTDRIDPRKWGTITLAAVLLIGLLILTVQELA